MATVTDYLPGLPDPQISPVFYDGVALKRGFAWIVDVILTALLTGLVALVLAPFTLLLSFFFIAPLYMVISFLYRWASLSRGAATPGMRLTAIEIRDRFGAPLDSGAAFLHTAGYTVSIAVFPLQLVSVALMLISERGQGLTDHVLGTTALNRVV
jgi:uncharacterized RDD family membrane protein YckC